MEETEGTEPAVDQEPQIDPQRLEELNQRLVSEQNLPLAIVAGLVSSLIGAAAWAAVSVISGYQLGLMAIAVGVLVGLAVRHLGKGISPIYSVIGAGFALFGCLFGNILTIASYLAEETEMTYGAALSQMLGSPEMIVKLMSMTFSPMDLIFYAIAIYEGYKLALRQLTEKDLREITA